jgi:6-phosphogluconolactonase (cycloisomerase 2 family)
MKFMKFGKALLLSALSVGVVLSVTGCVQSYSVGYLYVTGTVESESSGNGIVTGFKIDHNTGKLTVINGLPVASGGSNPIRAVLTGGSRFIYVLNRGISENPAGSSFCTTEYPCQNSNITQFEVGANGVLLAEQTFYTQGLNPYRMFVDSSGSFLYILEHDSKVNNAPSSASNPDANCAAALGNGASGVAYTSCGDITAFSINSTTGRLSLVQNSQLSASTGNSVNYFPVPPDTVDFVLSGTYILTLFAPQESVNTTTGAYTGGTSVFPYTYSSGTGQLVTSGLAYPWDTINVAAGTAIQTAGSYIYVLDNEPLANTDGSIASYSQVIPFSTGASGSLTALTRGPIADDLSQSNPAFIVQESAGKWFYVANQGNDTLSSSYANSGITGYDINSPYWPGEMSGDPVTFGSGDGPVCMVEDPSDQFIYTANYTSQVVTGLEIDKVGGALVPLSQSSKAPSSYSLTGSPTWCLVDGRTS